LTEYIQELLEQDLTFRGGVEHIRIESENSVEDVRLALETIVPRLDPAVADVLRKGDEERAERERQHGPKLSVFVTRDHGSLLAIYGRARKAYQYEIGNRSLRRA
jgi:hypothetical protein